MLESILAQVPSFYMYYVLLLVSTMQCQNVRLSCFAPALFAVALLLVLLFSTTLAASVGDSSLSVTSKLCQNIVSIEATHLPTMCPSLREEKNITFLQLDRRSIR
jgi:hypothetical protein